MYLITERVSIHLLNVIPTLLGYEFAKKQNGSIWSTIMLPLVTSTFLDDLQYDDAIPNADTFDEKSARKEIWNLV